MNNPSSSNRRLRFHDSHAGPVARPVFMSRTPSGGSSDPSDDRPTRVASESKPGGAKPSTERSPKSKDGVSPFHVKICGITRVEDARDTVRVGVDAIGLNFYPPSPRSIDLDQAEQIRAVIPESVAAIGLFVNESSDRIVEIAARLKLDFVQLHGDEPPEFLTELGSLRVIRALRVGEGGAADVCRYIDRCRQLDARPELLLLDAMVKGAYGGTGQRFDPQVAREIGELPDMPPVILAGGLTPDNVADAIRAARPVAVDTAGGVETAKGIKSADLVRQFNSSARRAFEELGR